MTNLDRHLAAVRVPAQHGVVTLPHGYGENVGVVREQQIRRAGNDQLFGIHQIRPNSFRPLIIDSRDVEDAVSPAQKAGLVAQKSDAITAAPARLRSSGTGRNIS